MPQDVREAVYAARVPYAAGNRPTGAGGHPGRPATGLDRPAGGLLACPRRRVDRLAV
ncbi:hypothetical protein GCM10010347_24360 [Streptomyces cirratus]|uniref:Uncharacterized protein n=1 Tax=Streptomyces cirratus TaxID=68187 RepID=A0ABQ3ER26_9ACTN|nr:hypothetical protein GCM10010347_24360 [Streptomyces cirratus]